MIEAGSIGVVAAPKPELPEGHFSDPDIAAYRHLMGAVPSGGRVVEVGVYKGRSICSVADIIIDRGLYAWGVDTWRNVEELIPEAVNNLRCFGLDKSLIVLREMSHIAAEYFHRGTLDLAFIDAAHEGPSILMDIVAWLPRVKVGGVICGHDYDTPLWPDVKEVVDSVLGVGVKKAWPESLVWAYTVKEGDEERVTALAKKYFRSKVANV